MKAHLLHEKNQGIAICKKVSLNERIKMKNEEDEYEKMKKNLQPKVE